MKHRVLRGVSKPSNGQDQLIDLQRVLDERTQGEVVSKPSNGQDQLIEYEKLGWVGKNFLGFKAL